VLCEVCKANYPESWGFVHCDHSSPGKDYTKRKANQWVRNGYVSRNAPNQWTEIHERLAAAVRSNAEWNPIAEESWYRSEWVPKIPSYGCSCEEHWKQLTAEFPIDWTTARAAFGSFFRLHNIVSEKHAGRPTITLQEAEGQYRLPVVRKPRGIVTFATGDHLKVLDLTRPYLQAYADRCGAEYVELTNNMHHRWAICNKFRMASIAWHYDQCLLIDSDIIVKPSAPDIFEAVGPDCVLAGRDEWGDYQGSKWYAGESKEFYESQGVQFEIQNRQCMNAGMMLFTPAICDLYFEPPDPYPRYWCVEQFWWWYQIRDVEVTWLDDRWNWPWIRKDFAAGAKDAYFLHFNGIKDMETRLGVMWEYL
jgi:hypothetical protein